MPHAEPAALPKVLRRQLSALAGKVLRVQWTLGLICAIILLCTLLGLQMLADWVFDLALGVRALLLVVDVLLLGALVWWFGIRPWRRRLNQEQAALHAERHWPALRSSVISAVQLVRRSNGSNSLVEELLRQVSTRVQAMDFREAVSAKHLKRPLQIAFLLALALGAGIALSWETSQVLLRRVALANIPLPTQTIVVPISGDMTVAPGTDVELAARAQGIIPRSGRVEITYEGQKPLTLTLSPRPQEADYFSTTLQNVQQPFRYRMFLNDGRSPELKVAVVHGPVLESISFEQHYPAYAQREPTAHTAGNLTLMAGGTLRIAGKADQELSAAALVLEPRARETPLTLSGDSRGLSGELPIPKEDLSSFSIVLTNKEGANSVENTAYRVVLVPDSPPEVTFTDNAPVFQTIIPETRPRLLFEVRDDYAVQEVTLCARLDAEEVKDFRVPIPIAEPGSRVLVDFTLQDPTGAGLPWVVGTTLTWWVEAKDNNDVTGPGIGKSTERQWSIISLAEKQQELLEKLNGTASTIRDLSRTQDTLRKGVEEIIPAAQDQ